MDKIEIIQGDITKILIMSKYDSLWKYLQNNGNKQMKLSFEEIKNIIGFDIDHSFLTYKKEAKEFDYEVDKISLKEKHVIFLKLKMNDECDNPKN